MKGHVHLGSVFVVSVSICKYFIPFQSMTLAFQLLLLAVDLQPITTLTLCKLRPPLLQQHRANTVFAPVQRIYAGYAMTLPPTL